MTDDKSGKARANGTDAVDLAKAFAVFAETGIIAQLTATLLEARLPKGMVAAQFGVLNHLSSRTSGETPVQLARAFQVPKTSMGHSLAVLERMALIAMLPNPDDGRSKIVRITPAGAAFRGRVIAALAPDVTAALAGTDPEMLNQILPMLRHIRTALDTARDV